MEKKYFTLEEANQLIPYISLQLQFMQKKKQEISYLINELEAEGYKMDELFRKEKFSEQEGFYRTTLEQLGDQINATLNEIQDQGCLVKDIDKGLVDFYGKIEDQEVFLCWKQGESEVGHWHYTTEGFANRKTLFERRILENFTKLH